MSVSFFAVTGTDALTGDIVPGLDYAEFNISAVDARVIEAALGYTGTEDGDIVAGDLPAREFLTRISAVADSDRNYLTEMAWNLADEADRLGADFIAWA